MLLIVFFNLISSFLFGLNSVVDLSLDQKKFLQQVYEILIWNVCFCFTRPNLGRKCLIGVVCYVMKQIVIKIDLYRFFFYGAVRIHVQVTLNIQ
jgi:hypothetical protein